MAELYERLYERYLEEPGRLEEDLSRDLSFCPENLDEKRQSHAQVFSKWAIMASIAETKYRIHKDFINTHLWPDLKDHARRVLLSKNERDTKERMEEMAYRDPAYISAAETRRKLGQVLDILKKAESAFWHRKDMIGGMSRRERREEFATPKVSTPQTSELEEHIDKTLSKPPRVPLEDLEAAATQVIRRNRNGS